MALQNGSVLSFESLMAGAPVVLPSKLVISLKPGFGAYATCEGEGWGVTLKIERDGASKPEHFPNRVQAWQRAQALQAAAVRVSS